MGRDARVGLMVPKVMPGSAAVLPSYMLGMCEQHLCTNSRLPYSPIALTADQNHRWLPVMAVSKLAEIELVYTTYTGNLDDNVIGVLQLRPLHLLHLDREWPDIVQCLHGLDCHFCSN